MLAPTATLPAALPQVAGARLVLTYAFVTPQNAREPHRPVQPSYSPAEGHLRTRHAGLS